ncbi:MAG: universal stress protein [Candidatus Limnocylindrales bacterium]
MTEPNPQPAKATTARVLFPTDGSEAARAAEAWITRLRWRDRVIVDVLSVASPGITRMGWSMEGDRATARQAAEQLRQSEVIASERTANDASLRFQEAGLRTRTLARQGDVAEEIIAAADAERPDLVVLGPRGRSRIAQFFLGSVSRQIIEDVQTPVLVARQPPAGEGPLPQRVLVLADGDRPAASAVDWLAETGLVTDAHVVLLGLLGQPEGIEHEDPDLASRVYDSLRSDASASLEALATRLADQVADIELEARTGHPFEATMEVAERVEPDLIVVARHRSRRGHAPFAEKITRYGSMSVLTVPEL